MSSIMNIVFISTSLNYPIHWKRINTYMQLGVPSSALGFLQQFGYPDKELPIEYRSLGYIKSGHYIRRLVQILKAVPTIRRSTKNTSLIYAFGLDGALISILSVLFSKNKPKLVCEIHDIRHVMLQRGIKGYAARRIEALLMKKISLLVVTAKSYISKYYIEVLGLRDIKSFVLENKLWDENIGGSNGSPPTMSPLRIGYIGSLRCPEAWNTLLQIAKNANGAISIYVRGTPVGIDSFYDDLKNSPNIFYGGPYRDPDDIPHIYETVDVVWSASFNKKASYVWSRTCKFYNACYYKRPIIAQAGTDEGKVIEDLNIGFCIDLNNISGTMKQMMSITEYELLTWYRNLNNLANEIYIYSDEHQKLLEILKNLTSRE